MSVYVDELLDWPSTSKWRHGAACHMFSTSLDELHDFAKKLGLKFEWFQTKTGMPHYDLTENKRTKAIKLGAVETDRRETAMLVRAWRRARGLNGTATAQLIDVQRITAADFESLPGFYEE